MKLKVYATANGKEPFLTWLNGLVTATRAIVEMRLQRMEIGHLSDCKRLKNAKGVWEARIRCGPGYRLYFGKDGERIVVLLCGGSKGTQIKDIERARKYWEDYLANCKE